MRKIIDEMSPIKVLMSLSAHLREQIRDLLPLRAKLVLVSEHCEKRILDQRVQERDELRALKRECQRLQRVIESMRGQQTTLQVQVEIIYYVRQYIWQLYSISVNDKHDLSIGGQNIHRTAAQACQFSSVFQPQIFRSSLKIMKQRYFWKKCTFWPFAIHIKHPLQYFNHKQCDKTL